jgi:methionyl aminopeptidase
VNEVVVHGIPDSRPLQEGDIVNVDVTVYLGGVHADTSATFAMGQVNDKVGRRVMPGMLVDVAMQLCICQILSVCSLATYA